MGEVVASVHIEATPEVVFPYFTDPALLAKWFGAALDDFAPAPGGAFAMHIGDRDHRGEFVSVEPPSRLVFTWGHVGEGGVDVGGSTVEVVLTADDGGTRVVLTHTGLPEDEVAPHTKGWNHFLGVLVGVV